MTVNIYRIKTDGSLSKSYKSLNRVTVIEDVDDEFVAISTAYDNDKTYVRKEGHWIELFI